MGHYDFICASVLHAPCPRRRLPLAQLALVGKVGKRGILGPVRRDRVTAFVCLRKGERDMGRCCLQQLPLHLGPQHPRPKGPMLALAPGGCHLEEGFLLVLVRVLDGALLVRSLGHNRHMAPLPRGTGVGPVGWLACWLLGVCRKFKMQNL